MPDRPELIRCVFDSMHIAIKAQLATEWSTGARASPQRSTVRVCDLLVGKKRAQITLPRTKNCEDVPPFCRERSRSSRNISRGAASSTTAKPPLFLTWRRKPSCSGKNKTGFDAGKPRGPARCADPRSPHANWETSITRTLCATIDQSRHDGPFLDTRAPPW